MFAKPRPVPSKAALRVLYQLAYISSGTAAGLGVLCGEESRRRTQIVQRIADNARQIRQHPRYVANAAALAVREAEGAVEHGGGTQYAPLEYDGRDESGLVSQQLDGGMKRRKKRPKRMFGEDAADEGVKARELPSVVERGYDDVTARPYRRERSRRRTATRDPKVWRPDDFSYGPPQEHPRQRQGSAHLPPTRADARPHSFVLSGAEATSTPPRMNDSRSVTLARPYAPLTASRVTQEVTFPASVSIMHEHQIPQSHTARCHGLLDESRVVEALDLFSTVSQNDGDESEWIDLFDKLFDAALERKMFLRCGNLLRLRDSSFKKFDFASQCRRLIKACAGSHYHELLLDLFFRGDALITRLRRSHLLDQRSRAVLATACTSDPGLFGAFERLYRSLDTQWRGQVDKTRCHLLLLVTWRSTKNLEAVLSKMRPMVDRFRETGNENALRLVDTTMAKIYISANRIDDALKTISRIHRADRASPHVIGLTALCFANMRAWDSFTEVLRIGEAAPLSKSTKSVRKTFNRIIYVYSMHHSAAQTWKFVTYLMDRFHFDPDDRSNAIVLEAFVSKQAIELVPKWLRMLRIRGHTAELDATIASQMLTRYYRDHRPSHVLVMWFCRNLAHWVPSFDPNEFLGLVQESMDNDLGGSLERNAVWQRENIEKRLARLQNADGGLPSPGYKHRRKLHFKHPNAKVDTQTSVAASDSPRTDQASTSVPATVDGIAEVNDQIRSTHEAPNEQEERHRATASLLNMDHDSLEQDVWRTFAGSSLFHVPVEPQMESNILQSLDKESHQLRTSMHLALSRRQYEKVLEMYDGCLDAIGLPSFGHALTFAVQASLKLDGDGRSAEKLIWGAEEAGMNVTSALVPMIMHHMRTLSHKGRYEARKLVATVSKFYNTNQENGTPVGPHVAVTAAHTLIKNGHPETGLSLLADPNLSGGAHELRSNIIVIAIRIKGFAALGKFDDVVHQASEVLQQDFRITPGFLRELRRAYKAFPSSHWRERARLDMCMKLCESRRREQAFESKSFGKKLVACIAKCTRQGTPVDVDDRPDLDERLFGPQLPRHEAVLRRGERLPWRDRKRQRRAQSASGHPQLRQAYRLHDVRWLRRYRAFLRRPLVMRDGRQAAFRYYSPSESSHWRVKEKEKWREKPRRTEAAWAECDGEADAHLPIA